MTCLMDHEHLNDSPIKTPSEIEKKVIAKKQTHPGPIRLSLYFAKYKKIEVAQGTIRHVVWRNRHRLTYNLPSFTRRRIKRDFIDWYSAKPFVIVQMNLKHFRDQKALTKAQIMHLDQHNIPNYQWSAIDENIRYTIPIISMRHLSKSALGVDIISWLITQLMPVNLTAVLLFCFQA